MESACRWSDNASGGEVEGEPALPRALHRALALAAADGEEGLVLARHLAARVGEPCVTLSHSTRGWRVEGAAGVDLHPGEGAPSGATPVSWLAGCAGAALQGHEIRHAGRVVGLAVVRAGIAAEAVAPACEMAAPFFAAMTAVHSFEMHCARLASELRRPLCTLGLSLELLGRMLIGRDPEHEHMERSQRALQSVNQLVDDLLTFVAPPRRTRIRLALMQLVDDVLEDLGADAALKGLRFQVLGEPQALVVGDEGALSRALANMLSNAIDASPPGGVVEVALAADTGEVIVEVRDQGPGVRAELREKVFEPFYTTREQGSGLGLAVLREIVHAHGGTVEFLDGPGGVIQVRLPRASAGRRQRGGATLAEAARALLHEHSAVG